MKYCPECGTKRIDKAKFCYECGHKYSMITITSEPEAEKVKATAVPDVLPFSIKNVETSMDDLFVINTNRTYIEKYPINMEPTVIRSMKTEGIRSISFSADSKYIVGGTDDSIIFWDVRNQERVYQINYENKTYNNIDRFLHFTPDGKKLLYSHSGSLFIWDLLQRKLVDQFSYDYSSYTVISPDSSLLATVHKETVKIWSISEKRLVNIISHKNVVEGIDFSSNNKYLFISESGREEIKVWDYVNLVVVEKYYMSDEQILSNIKISPDGKKLAYLHKWSYEFDGFIFSKKERVTSIEFEIVNRVNKYNSGKTNRFNKVEINNSVKGIHTSFSPNSQLAAMVTNYGKLHLYDFDKDRFEEEIWIKTGGEIQLDKNLLINHIVFSPDGRLLATADRTKINIWKLA